MFEVKSSSEKELGRKRCGWRNSYFKEWGIRPGQQSWMLTWEHKLIKVKLVWIAEFFIPTMFSYLGARERGWDPPMSGLCRLEQWQEGSR